LVERARHWQVEGFRRVASLGTERPHGTESALAKELDELVARLDITHDELARRIGIGKTTYFEVKSGGGKRSTRLKVEQYVQKVNKSEPKS